MGIKKSSVTGWAHGRQPRRATLQKIADYFKCSVDDLLENNEIPAPGDGDGRVAEFERAVNLLFADHPENLSRLLDALAADPEKTKAKFDLFLATL